MTRPLAAGNMNVVHLAQAGPSPFQSAAAADCSSTETIPMNTTQPLFSAPAGRVAAFPDPGSASAALHERARKVMPGGNTRHTVFFPPYPLYAVRGQGSHVWGCRRRRAHRLHQQLLVPDPWPRPPGHRRGAPAAGGASAVGRDADRIGDPSRRAHHRPLSGGAADQVMQLRLRGGAADPAHRTRLHRPAGDRADRGRVPRQLGDGRHQHVAVGGRLGSVRAAGQRSRAGLRSGRGERRAGPADERTSRAAAGCCASRPDDWPASSSIR